MAVPSRLSRTGALCVALVLCACNQDSTLPVLGIGAGGAAPGAPTAIPAGFALDLAQRQVLAARVTGQDFSGRGITFSVASPPENGHVQMEPDGRFHYAPRCGFTGTDEFVFVTNDGRLDSAPATVTVAVSGELAPFVSAAPIMVANLEAARIAGPLARGGIGDFVLENGQIKVIIQGSGRAWGTINPYGGTIIDAVPRCSNNGVPLDHFEEHASGVNIETAPNPTTIEVVANPPANTAQVRVTAKDDLLDFINGSSAIRNLGFQFPPSADDRNLPVIIETLYTLGQGDRHVRIDVDVRPDADEGGTSNLSIYMVEYVNGSGEVEAFQHGMGFGEPLVVIPCTDAPKLATNIGPLDPCHYVIYGGNDRGAGVSYGFLHQENGSSSVSVSGVTVPVLGANAVTLFLTAEEPGGDQPNYIVAPEPAAEFPQRRYFVVGRGTVAEVLDVRNTLYAVQTGRLEGTATVGGEPVANAEIAVLGQAYGTGASLNVVSHYRTGSDGRYSMTLPPGSNYTVRANRDGHPYPANQTVNIVAGQTATANFAFAPAARLKVRVTDASGQPIPAKVQLVGFDPSAPVVNTQNVANGAINNRTGVFGDLQADRLPTGIAFAEFIGRTGVSPAWEVEPGEYQLAVSRGPRYSAHLERITLTGGQTLEKAVRLALVVPTPGYVTGDFHVHAIDSPDSEVAQTERVATYIAEGTDFFTPSDHERRVDFGPTIAAMQVGHLVGTAPSAEITTFDYGHFNSWPVTAMAGMAGGGTVDWGGAVETVGEDFPAFGNYVLSPEELIAAAHSDPMPNIVQINHIEGHFGPEGLRIDTAQTPPQSNRAGSERRLDPSVTNYFTNTFDALEIWITVDGRNEAGNGAPYENLFEENMGDWFNMINQGIRRTGVTTSDTHERRLTSLAGRTLMPSAVTAPGQLSAHAGVLAGTVKAGRAIGTNAPFLTLSVDAPSTGQSGGLGLDQPLLVRTTAAAGAVNVHLEVRSPEWAPYDRIEFYMNNAPEHYLLDGADRYRVCPDHVMNAVDEVTDPATEFEIETVFDHPSIPGASHYESTVTLPLSGLTVDTWIVAVVRGTDGVSEPMFPVVPNDLAAGGNNTTLDGLTDGNLGEKGMPALAFTNPVFVDVDGNGAFDPPGVTLGNCP